MPLTKRNYYGKSTDSESEVKPVESDGSKEEANRNIGVADVHKHDPKVQRLLELERKTDRTEEETEEMVKLRRETRPSPNSDPVPA